MTKEEKLKILLEAEDRALVALSKTEAGDETVDRLLGQINGICFLQDRLGLVNPCTCGGECCGNAEEAPTQETEERPTPAAEPEASKAEEVSTPTSVKAEHKVEKITPPPVKSEPESTLTRDDVIRVLTPVQTSGPDGLIAGVMQEMGFTKLSEIPAGRYKELLDRVEAAMKTEEQ